MFMPWISDSRLSKLAIVGICKNAGKTSILNAIIAKHRLAWGIMSTGHDGESTDLLFKTPKPRVILPQGSLFCADSGCMDGHGAGISILAKTPWLSGGKQLWIARAEQDLETEIGGPANVQNQISCAKLLLSLGADKALIDGSLDRKSIALSDSLDAIILAIGASFGSLNSIELELQRLLRLSELPCYSSSCQTAKLLKESQTIQLCRNGGWSSTGLKSLLGHEKELITCLEAEPSPTQIYIPGAYTSHVHSRLGKLLQPIQLVFRHPESIKLSYPELELFYQTHQAQCLIPFNIKAIAINSQGVGAPAIDADIFRQQLRKRFPQFELIDIMETV